MSWVREYWERLYERLYTPISAPEVEEQLRKAREQLPIPVFWLLGKTQAGKTSVIRALTGSSRAEIGQGFRPCTRSSQLYDFPNQEDCLLRFLDTRGLGEAGYDPTEDLQYCATQSHLLVVVMKALDHALEEVLQTVRAVRKTHPHWPLLVVQTSLHEGYLPRTAPHLLPYCYTSHPLPTAVPIDLARSLAAQRELFVGLNAKFVPVDFTLPEDGFTPEHYGLESLWEAIEEQLPMGLRSILVDGDELQEGLRDAYFRAARPHLISYAIAAGTVATAMPVPLLDMPSVLAIQARMFQTIAALYGQPLTKTLFAEFGGALGLGIVARMAGRELTKVVPVFGEAVSGAYAAATTFALGCALCKYFTAVRSGHLPDAKKIRELYASELTQARQTFAEYLAKQVK